MVAGTILAAAAVAGMIAVVDEFSGEGIFTEEKLLGRVILILGPLSLGGYINAVIWGLLAPFQPSPATRKQHAERAAYGVIFQAAVVFVGAAYVALSLLVKQIPALDASS